MFPNDSAPTPWQTLSLAGGVARVRPATAPGPQPVFVLLHGWTGNETSILRFMSALPEHAFLVSFRAPYPAHSERGGYSWVDYHPNGQPPSAAQYQPALTALTRWLATIQQQFPEMAWTEQHWLGFSQGASTAGLYALTHPHHIATVALLSGFLPRGSEHWVTGRPLVGKHAFIAHGRHDTIVRPEHAQRARALLTAAGADVQYCEDDVGHKVSARCHKALKAFYAHRARR